MMFVALLAGAMTATALISGGPPTGAPVPPVTPTVAEVTVESDVKTMPYFAASQTFGELRCPAGTTLVERKYGDGVPPGLEVRTFGGDGVVTLSLALYQGGRPAGVLSATAFNWSVPSSPRTVQLVAHCVAS